MATKLILDTDIGDDIDDALALGLICGCPELELLGVTTVFGNTVARARQAQTVLQYAGGKHASIPVAAGCGAALTARPLHDWRYSLDVLPNQDASCLPADQLPELWPGHGVDFLIEQILAGDGDVIPVTIGAMTNLAMAIVKEPKILPKIPKIVSMATEFYLHHAEWNILCDPEAAGIVFRTGIPMDVVPFRIGKIVQFGDEHLERLAGAVNPLSKNLHQAVELWRAHTGHPHPWLYDPMTILALVQPELMTWKQGTVTVELSGDSTFGFTKFKEGEGPHRVAWEADREASLDLYFDRVLAV